MSPTQEHEFNEGRNPVNLDTTASPETTISFVELVVFKIHI